MRSLYQSLEEVCVKDMLEGDNKYTCSQCGTKVSHRLTLHLIIHQTGAS